MGPSGQWGRDADVVGLRRRDPAHLTDAAGGHPTTWAAGRSRLAPGSPGPGAAIEITGVIRLAGVVGRPGSPNQWTDPLQYGGGVRVDGGMSCKARLR
jgi:hypothetical protein